MAFDKRQLNSTHATKSIIRTTKMLQKCESHIFIAITAAETASIEIIASRVGTPIARSL